MGITLDTAESIIDTLLENEYIKYSEVPEEFDTRIELAEYWIHEAEKAWVENPTFAKKEEAIVSILNMSPDGFPDRGSNKEEKVNHNLPIPREPDFDYTHLPADFTELTDLEIRRYSSHNQHFLNRARYLLSQVINHQANAIHLRDDAYRKAYKHYNAEILQSGERPTKDLINSFAMEDEHYMKYDQDAIDAQAEITSLKALVEIYSGNVERLSREWTMRQNEWEKSR